MNTASDICRQGGGSSGGLKAPIKALQGLGKRKNDRTTPEKNNTPTQIFHETGLLQGLSKAVATQPRRTRYILRKVMKDANAKLHRANLVMNTDGLRQFGTRGHAVMPASAQLLSKRSAETGHRVKSNPGNSDDSARLAHPMTRPVVHWDQTCIVGCEEKAKHVRRKRYYRLHCKGIHQRKRSDRDVKKKPGGRR